MLGNRVHLLLSFGRPVAIIKLLRFVQLLPQILQTVFAFRLCPCVQHWAGVRASADYQLVAGIS